MADASVSVKLCSNCGAAERGKRARCKTCEADYHRAWRAANAERVAAKHAAWAAANKEKVRQASAQHYARNREKLTQWRSKNRERLAEKTARYRAENPAKVKAALAAWYVKNKGRVERYKAARRVHIAALDAARYLRLREFIRARVDAWNAAHPWCNRIRQQNRRARQQSNGGTISKDVDTKLLVLQRAKCAACRKELSGGYHIDHIMPLALGGPHDDKNLQLLCPSCNLSKHCKHPVDFMRSRGFLL